MFVVGRIVFFLVILSNEANAVQSSGSKARILDPRCIDTWDVEDFKDDYKGMIISRSIYEREGRLVCENNKKREVPQFSEGYNWLPLIEYLGNVTSRGLADCAQYPQIYAHIHKALKDTRIRNRCSVVPKFCESCESGCRLVSPLAYSSRETMISWAIESIGVRDSQCQRTWITSNIEQELKRNATWILEIKEACETCFEAECTTVKGQFVSNLLMSELGKRHREPQAVWNHLCRYAAAMGKFDYTTFSLEERFNAYDEFIQLMMAFQSNAWWCFPVVIIFMIACTAFFHVPNKYRDFFDLSAHIESYKRFKADRLLQWAIKRLSTKVQRMRAKAATAIQRLKAAVTMKKPAEPTSTANNKKTSAASAVSTGTEPKTKSKAISNSNKKNDKNTGSRGEPAGRGRRRV